MKLRGSIYRFLEIISQESSIRNQLSETLSKGERDSLKRQLTFIGEHRRHLEKKIREVVNQPVFLVVYSVSDNIEKRYYQRIFGGLSEEDIRSYIEFLRYTNPHQGLINLEEIKPLSISTLLVDG